MVLAWSATFRCWHQAKWTGPQDLNFFFVSQGLNCHDPPPPTPRTPRTFALLGVSAVRWAYVRHTPHSKGHSQ